MKQTPSREAVWAPAETPLICIGTKDETADVKTFRLAPSDGSRIRFQAGQNLTLEWTMPDGKIVHRTFTIASPPTCKTHVEITVKAQAGTAYATRDMHARLTQGSELRAFGPGGRFGLAYAPAEKVLLIGGGSGVTPMISMLRWIRDRRYDIDVVYLSAARTPADILFAEELAEADADLPNARIQMVVADVPEGQSWFGPRGFLDRRLLTTLVPDARSRETFCCGPAPFMSSVRRALAASGMDMARYHEESFGSAPPKPPQPPSVPASGWTLSLARSRKTAEIRPSEPLVQTLRRAGVVVPTGCKSGICGTCRIRKLAGTVAMTHQGGLSPTQEAAGDILACCAFGHGDVELDL